MKNVIILVLNTLKVTFRKKSNIFSYLIVPLVSMLIIMSIMNGGGSAKIKIGVVDKDNSIISTDMVKYLESTGKFESVYINEANIDGKVVNREVNLAIIIPESFSEEIYNNKLENIKIVSIEGKEITAWIENYTNLYIQNLLDISKASEGNRDEFNDMYKGYKNQALKLNSEKVVDKRLNKQLTQSGVGFLIMFILIGATSTSNIILKEKRERTYQRICSTPVNSKIYIMGNVFVNFIIITVQILLAIFAINTILKVNMYMPDYQLFLMLLLMGAVSIGIGMIVVAFSKSTSEAGYLSTLIITPTCMMGGCFWPIELMPEKVQKISNFIPQKWAIEAIKKLQSGAGISEIYINMLILIGFTVVLFLVAAFKMNNTDKTGSFV
ncbi:ABC transporter permease [Clostridium ganghwense]|uniref:Transport permease protein n=1 Tax=Clostridium ganghwense TaxID=312089 RepID=A0ABT4CKU2_9CLOT|nr:ABC transporter permease [Clostridium ganghwense]MCY6369647.1 ABC transporter permease [Clostridium ganghwense]